MRFDLRRLTPAFFLASLLGLVASVLAFRSSPIHVEVIRSAWPAQDQNAGGLQSLLDTCNKLITPMVVVAAAAMPLATIGGAVLMAFGSRRGVQVVITSLAAMALVGAAKAIVA
jgi:hypothetical protein